MELRYSLTRTEIVLTFLSSLARSPKLLMIVLVYCLIPSLIPLLVRGAMSRSLTARDAVTVVLWMMGVFCSFVVMIFIRGKTARRIVNVTEQGISTTIGKLNGRVPWSKVADVKDAGNHVLIIGRSGNSFFIPDRAFNGADDKSKFISDMERWRSAL